MDGPAAAARAANNIEASSTTAVCDFVRTWPTGRAGDIAPGGKPDETRWFTVTVDRLDDVSAAEYRDAGGGVGDGRCVIRSVDGNSNPWLDRAIE